MTWQSRLLIVFVMLQFTELQAAEPLLPRVPFEPAKAKYHQQDWATAAGVPVESSAAIAVFRELLLDQRSAGAEMTKRSTYTFWRITRLQT